jgi:hypothetical protein
MNDDKLTRDARLLATEIAPERDLWPGIEAAITSAAPASSGSMPWYAQAAAVLLLVGGSSALTWFVTNDDADVVNGAALVSNVELDAEFASFGEDFALAPSYSDAHTNLEADLDIELDRLPPEARISVEENLAIIRAAIREINAELAKDPDNRLLQDLLLETYREELTVMRDVGELTRDVMSRNDF